jgi:hypothetical protein
MSEDVSPPKILATETLNINESICQEEYDDDEEDGERKVCIIPETIPMDLHDLTMEEEFEENTIESVIHAPTNRSANTSPIFCNPADLQKSTPMQSPNLFDKSFSGKRQNKKGNDASTLESPSPSVLRNVCVLKKDSQLKTSSNEKAKSPKKSKSSKTPTKMKQTKLSVHAFKTSRRVELMRDQGKLVDRTLTLQEEEALVLEEVREASLQSYAAEKERSKEEDEPDAPLDTMPSLLTLDEPLNGTLAPGVQQRLFEQSLEDNGTQENAEWPGKNCSHNCLFFQILMNNSC